MHSNNRYVIGLDGGGTSTKLVIGDVEGNILAYLETASTNIKSNPEAVVKKLLHEAVATLLTKIDASPEEVVHMFLALAGGDRPEDQIRWQQWVQESLPSSSITVRNDAVAALLSGTHSYEGAVLIAGTGSICYSLSNRGQQVDRVGGWGYLFGDEGSGFSIGTAALRQLMQGHDGRKTRDEAFENALLSHCQLSKPTEFITYVYENESPRALISSLAGPVLDLASRQNETAMRIVDEAVQSLAHLVQALTQKNQQPIDSLVLTGGLLRSAHFRKKLIDQLRFQFPEIHVIEPAYPPVVGAYVGSLLETGRMIENDRKDALTQSWQALVREEV